MGLGLSTPAPAAEQRSLAQQYRDDVDREAKLRSKCFADSQDAWARGDRAAAKQLSDEGKRHGELMRQAIARANEAALAEANRRAGGDVTRIDLHGLYVEGALAAVDERLALLQSTPANTPTHRLTIICGAGNHSAGGVAKIRPALKEHLAKLGLEFAEQHDGGALYVEVPAAQPSYYCTILQLQSPFDATPAAAAAAEPPAETIQMILWVAGAVLGACSVAFVALLVAVLRRPAPATTPQDVIDRIAKHRSRSSTSLQQSSRASSALAALAAPAPQPARRRNKSATQERLAKAATPNMYSALVDEAGDASEPADVAAARALLGSQQQQQQQSAEHEAAKKQQQQQQEPKKPRSPAAQQGAARRHAAPHSPDTQQEQAAGWQAAGTRAREGGASEKARKRIEELEIALESARKEAETLKLAVREGREANARLARELEAAHAAPAQSASTPAADPLRSRNYIANREAQAQQRLEGALRERDQLRAAAKEGAALVAELRARVERLEAQAAARAQEPAATHQQKKPAADAIPAVTSENSEKKGHKAQKPARAEGQQRQPQARREPACEQHQQHQQHQQQQQPAAEEGQQEAATEAVQQQQQQQQGQQTLEGTTVLWWLAKSAEDAATQADAKRVGELRSSIFAVTAACVAQKSAAL
eukprot:m51a1_g3251 hypothetical protein (653) ;mRNA; f:152576-155116